jgi:hypothetical protein
MDGVQVTRIVVESVIRSTDRPLREGRSPRAGGRRLGFEFKRTTAPAVTRSMQVALADLGLERLQIVHAGSRSLPLAPRIGALAIGALPEELEPLR